MSSGFLQSNAIEIFSSSSYFDQIVPKTRFQGQFGFSAEKRETPIWNQT